MPRAPLNGRPPPAASGRQVELDDGRWRAVVTEVGATLRRLELSGRAVIEPFDEDEICPGGHGQLLAPWPNRLEDGSYAFGGRSGRVPIDEGATSNAIHGLVRWLSWSVDEHVAGRATLSCTLPAQPAYPFALRLSVTYELAGDGLVVTTRAENGGGDPLPFGLGFHPYLTAGTATVDDSRLELAAARRLVLDHRQLPMGDEAVAGTDYDFTSGGRKLGSLRFDDCFFDVAPGPDGRLSATLTDDASGRSVTIWAEEEFGWWMCYTGDTLADPARRRRAVALEPMTCPPNALRSGIGVRVVPPGEELTLRFGIAASD